MFHTKKRIRKFVFVVLLFFIMSVVRSQNPCSASRNNLKNGVKEQTVLIEFESLEKALQAYESPEYQEALKALDGGADRDFRIFEGL